jgi:hypothetical protein
MLRGMSTVARRRPSATTSFLSALALAGLAVLAGAPAAGAMVALQRGNVVMVAGDDGAGVRVVGSVRRTQYTTEAVRLAPDGRHVAAFTKGPRRDQRVVVLDAAGGGARRVVALAQPLSFAWLDASTLVVSTTARSSNDVYRVSLLGGAPARIARFRFRPCTNGGTDAEGFDCGPRLQQLTASPDGSRIAVSGPPGPQALRVLNRAGRTLFTRGGNGNGSYQVLGAAFDPSGVAGLATTELPNYSAAQRVTRLDAGGTRRVVWTSAADGGVGSSIAWSTDGATLAWVGFRSIVSDDPRLFTWRSATGAVRQVGAVHATDELEWIAGFVDATHAVVQGEHGRIGMLDVTTGAVHPLLRSTMLAVDARPVPTAPAA